MNIETFKSECDKLINRFGNENLESDLLNEVWSQIKHLDDEHIEKTVSYLISSKPIHGEAFSVDDFVEKPVERKRGPGYMPNYNNKTSDFDSHGLKNFLEENGVSSVSEALIKAQKKGGL